MPSESDPFTASQTPIGGGAVTWGATAPNAFADDDSDAIADNALPVTRTSYELHVYTAGLSDMGDADTVDGVTYALRYHDVGAGVVSDDSWARMPDASKSTDNETGGVWPDAEGDDTRGGSTDPWGETLTGANVKDANFGFIIQASIYGFAAAHVDSIVMTVDYTPGAAAEMRVEGYGTGLEIADGDTTPRVADNTDFGIAVENLETVDARFTIFNSGDANLDLTDTPAVVIGGADANQFSVQNQPTSPIAPAGSVTFTLRFTPTSTGVKSATVSIANNDADENPYNFSIQGTGVVATGTDLMLTGLGS